MTVALILVDIQNDFCPGGALAVRDGDAVVPVANYLMNSATFVVATQDWHPADHGSFASRHPGRKPFELGELAGLPQVLWPDHCVQGTSGAELHAGLDRARITRVFPKGTDPAIDSYSGFFDNGRRRDTGLHAWLRARGVTELLIAGLATDYCVKATALDALGLGWRTTVVADACRAVELAPGDGERALDEVRAAGGRVEEARTADLRIGHAGVSIHFDSTEGAFGCLSAASAHPFDLDGRRWPTGEHYVQAMRFADAAYQERIRGAASPMEAATLGRSPQQPLRPDWETVKDDVMRAAMLAKFRTHPDIARILLDTRDEELVYATTGDDYWGTGPSGIGANRLGIILMETRERLREEMAG